MLAILVAGEDTLGGVMYTHPEYELVVMTTVMQVTSSVCLTLVLQWWCNRDWEVVVKYVIY
jgi:hypothetical protein